MIKEKYLQQSMGSVTWELPCFNMLFPSNILFISLIQDWEVWGILAMFTSRIASTGKDAKALFTRRRDEHINSDFCIASCD